MWAPVCVTSIPTRLLDLLCGAAFAIPKQAVVVREGRLDGLRAEVDSWHNVIEREEGRNAAEWETNSRTYGGTESVALFGAILREVGGRKTVKLVRRRAQMYRDVRVDPSGHCHTYDQWYKAEEQSIIALAAPLWSSRVPPRACTVNITWFLQ
jgi:hypothetical protein